MNAQPAAPLILSLEFDAKLTEVAQQMRDEYFPPALNRVPAHVTLFHHLPGDQIELVGAGLSEVTAELEPIAVTLKQVRFLGKGVALAVDSVELLQVRGELARRWERWLTPQDRQPFRPHLTVQNKATPESARRLFETLTATWEPMAGSGEALLLWHYRGGPWERAGRFAFGSNAAGSDGPR